MRRPRLGRAALHRAPRAARSAGDLVSGYLIDVLLPAVLVLIVSLVPLSVLRRRSVLFVLVAGFGAVVETLQGMGVAVLGRTFDPWDYAAYALGAAVGLALDHAIRRRDRRGEAPPQPPAGGSSTASLSGRVGADSVG